MREVAAKIAVPDEWTPRERASNYVPPTRPKTIMLSEALRGTNRLPHAKQLDFLQKFEELRRSGHPVYSMDGSLKGILKNCQVTQVERE